MKNLVHCCKAGVGCMLPMCVKIFVEEANVLYYITEKYFWFGYYNNKITVLLCFPPSNPPTCLLRSFKNSWP